MTVPVPRSRWLAGRRPGPAGDRPALIIIPPGSAGPEAAAGWLDRLPNVDVAIVQLPGRGQRLFEQSAIDLCELGTTLAGELIAALPGRYAVLGHCSGAFLGLELAHRLQQAGQPPERLFISSSRSPAELADPGSDHARAAAETASMTDEQLTAELTTRGHLPGGQLDPEILAAALAAHRAAVRATASYRCERPPLTVAAEVWRGAQDDVVGGRHTQGWQPFLALPLSEVEFPGRRDHFEQPTPAAVARVRSVFTGAESDPPDGT